MAHLIWAEWADTKKGLKGLTINGLKLEPENTVPPAALQEGFLSKYFYC